jgi:hypothetical protein
VVEVLVMAAEPVLEDLGYGGQPAASPRFGIVYEADWGRGPRVTGDMSEAGTYIVVDRVQGFPTAWQMRVERGESWRKSQERLDMLRELVADQDERWQYRSEASRAVVMDGGRDSRGAWHGDAQQER